MPTVATQSSPSSRTNESTLGTRTQSVIAAFAVVPSGNANADFTR